MSSKFKLDPETLEELKQKLLKALQLPVAIAARSVNKVRILILINFFSIAWVSFYFIYLVDISYIWLLPLMLILILGLQILHLIKLYFALGKIIELPDKIDNFIITTTDKVSAFQPTKTQIQNSLRERKLKFSDILTLGKALRDAMSLAGEFQEISSVGVVLVLSNPVVIGISLMATLLWIFTAVITALVYVF